jgi:hypothetical protein
LRHRQRSLWKEILKRLRQVGGLLPFIQHLPWVAACGAVIDRSGRFSADVVVRDARRKV